MEDKRENRGFTHIIMKKKGTEIKLEYRCSEVIDLEEFREHYLLWTEYKYRREEKPYFFKKSEWSYQLVTKQEPSVIERGLKGKCIWRNPVLRRKGHE